MDDRGSATAGAGGGAGTVQIQQSRRLPDFLQSVNLKYVKLGYHYLISNLFTLCFVPLIIVTLIEASQMDLGDLRQLWLHLQYNLVSVIICSSFLVVGLTVYIMTRPRPVYLVDYSCYRAPDNLKAPFDRFMTHSELTGDFDDSSLEFQRKILERSGLGEETYVPEAMHFIPPRPSMAAAREEAEQVVPMSGVMPSLSPQAPLVGNVSRVATEMLARKSVKADVRLCRSRSQWEEEDVKEEAETVLDESEEEAPEVREHAPKDQNTSSTKKRALSSTKICGLVTRRRFGA